MNKLVCSALAASVVGATGFAGTGTDSWASLDRELESLSATLSAQSGGPQIGGWIITSLDLVEDGEFDPGPPPSVDDSLGFNLRSARVNVSGNVGDYGYRLSYDFGQENLFGGFVGAIKDAYATFRIGDTITGRLGNFKPPTLSSFLIERNRLLFLDRTIIATTFDRDLGAQVSGDFETVGWWIAAQNGADGTADELLFTARVAVDLMGEGVGAVEGAYGAPDGTALTLAAFFQDDGSFDDGTRIGAEARLTSGPFSAAGEVVDNDTDLGDNTPWNVTFSYLFTDQWEAAVRWEDMDDAADTTRISVGLNRYVMGHDVKWTAQFSTGDSDDAALENDAISIGLAVTF